MNVESEIVCYFIGYTRQRVRQRAPETFDIEKTTSFRNEVVFIEL